MVGGGTVLLRFQPAREPTQAAEGEWQPFTEAKAAALASSGKLVFVDFTAAWCWTCKVNEKAVIESADVKRAFADLKVATLKGDLTNFNPALMDYMKKLNRAGVPLYVIIPPNGSPDKPIVLPEVITKEMVIESLQKAAVRP